MEITVWSDPQSNPIWNPIQSKRSDPCFVEGQQEEKGEKICVRFVCEVEVSKPQRNTTSKYFQVTPPRTTTERVKWDDFGAYYFAILERTHFELLRVFLSLDCFLRIIGSANNITQAISSSESTENFLNVSCGELIRCRDEE